MKEKRLYITSTLLKECIYFVSDAFIIFFSFLLAFFTDFKVINDASLVFILGVVVSKLIVNLLMGEYKSTFSTFDLTEVIRIGIIIVLFNVFAKVVNKFFISPHTEVQDLSTICYIFATALECLLCVATRTLTRIIKLQTSLSSKDAPRTLIVGAGEQAKICFDEIHNNSLLDYNVVGFLDDDKQKISKRYLGKPVYGPVSDAHEIIEKYKINVVIIAIAKLTRSQLLQTVEVLSKENVIIKRLPLLTEMDLEKQATIKDVSLPELLGRDQIIFDSSEIASLIEGKRVLVTGAGGSIGSELVRQIFSFHPSTLILFDIYENGVYDIQQELKRKGAKEQSECKAITLIGSTYNEFRVEEIFEKYHPELVFHAAAYKHVPLMEDSPAEAIRTNVVGTYNVAKMANKYKALKMVLVSTDKAVRPTNTMGATKRFAEMIIQHFAKMSTTTYYAAVRFGNVLGSNGSVIPLFKKQIAEGGPVTVTHKDITRFFMTIPEAVSLILQSGAFAKGGEIFILDMGKQVKIVTLAENVIKQCGFVPYKDIDIIFTGLRPGEKIYEELLLDVTEHTSTTNSKIFIEKKKEDFNEVEEHVKNIQRVFEMTDSEEIKNALREVVTTYTYYEDFNKSHPVK